ncbi:MAG: metallophosphoesterase family protein [Rhodospirillales bacterium]|nr:metallophosphoesterase family protein [Rhodospirillales bacterium]
MSRNQQWAASRRDIEQSRYWISPVSRRTRWRKAVFNRLLAAFGLGLRLTPLYARGRRNALDLKRIDIEMALPGLPLSFDGYRILQVSDTHLDAFPALVDPARRLLAGLEVDMLALTGDVHGAPPAPIAYSVDLLMQALQDVHVRGPRLAVLGNHDPVEMAALLEEKGFDVLVNRSRVLERGGERLRVTGLDDVHNFYTDAARAAFEDHDGEYRIALVHSAEMADFADQAGYALYLSGHTHGGQICLPGGRPVITQLTRCRHAAAGLWRQGRMAGYTSAGLGVSDPPVRFNSRGEVTVITLRCA